MKLLEHILPPQIFYFLGFINQNKNDLFIHFFVRPSVTQVRACIYIPSVFIPTQYSYVKYQNLLN